MINPLTGSAVPDYPGFTANSETTAKPAARTETPVAEVKTTGADSVELSVAAQAKLLKAQGQSLSAIASQLGLDLKTITSYVS